MLSSLFELYFESWWWISDPSHLDSFEIASSNPPSNPNSSVQMQPKSQAFLFLSMHNVFAIDLCLTVPLCEIVIFLEQHRDARP